MIVQFVVVMVEYYNTKSCFGVLLINENICGGNDVCSSIDNCTRIFWVNCLEQSKWFSILSSHHSEVCTGYGMLINK